MGFDYNYFTKTELVEFLNEYGKDFGYTRKPYSIIMEKRQNNLHKELELIHEDNQRLLMEMVYDRQKGDVVGYLNKSKEMDKNHKKWEKLHQELDKVSKILVGD